MHDVFLQLLAILLCQSHHIVQCIEDSYDIIHDLFPIGGLNIYQGDPTLTLGMIWMLIQKYQIRMHGEIHRLMIAVYL